MRNIFTFLLTLTALVFVGNATNAQGTLGEYTAGSGAGGFDSGCGYTDAGNSDPGVSDASLAGNVCGSAFDATFGAWTETAGGFDITGFELNNYDIDDEAIYGIRLFFGPQNNCCTICLDAVLDLGQGEACGTFGPQADLSSFGTPVPANYGQDVFGLPEGILPYTDMCPNTEYFAQYQLISATAIDLTDPDGNFCAMDDALITNAGTLTTVQTLVAPGTRDAIVINSTTLALSGAADCGSTDVLLDFTADITAGCIVSFGTCSQGLEFEFRAALACADGSSLDITTGPLVNDPTGCFTGAAFAGQISLGSAADVCAILACDPAASLELYTTYTFCEADDIVGDGSGNDEAVMSVSVASILADYDAAMCCAAACPEFNAITYGPICNGYDICIGYVDTDADGIGDAGEDPTGIMMTVTDGIATSVAQAPINDGIFLFDADGDMVNDAIGYCYTVLFDNPTCDPEPYTPLVTLTCADGTEAMLLGGTPITDYDILLGTFGIAGGSAIYPPLVGIITPPVCPALPDGSDAVAGNVEVFLADAAGDPTATSCLVVPGPVPACDSDNTADPAANAIPVQFNPTNDPLFTALAGADSYTCGLNGVADLSIACPVCAVPVCAGDPGYEGPAEVCSTVAGAVNYSLVPGAGCLNPASTQFPTDDRYDYFITLYIDPATGAPGPAPAGFDAVTATNTLAPDLADVLGATVGNTFGFTSGTQCATSIDLVLTNPTCATADFSFFAVPLDYDSDLDGDLLFGDVLDDADPAYCPPVRYDVTIYPNLTVTTTPSTDCTTVTATIMSDGDTPADCTPTDGTQELTCTVDGDLTFDFTGAFSDPLGCSTLTATAACSGCVVGACSITPDAATNIVCDDAGTPEDPSDDTYTFDILVNGANTDAAASNTFNDDQGNAGVAYGTTVSYGPFPISGGNITVNFTDVDDAACVAMMMAAAPAPCSTPVGACSITPDAATNIVCDDAGTPEDPSDDTYTFDIVVNGSNTDAAASNTFNDDQGNAGIAYGTTLSYGPFPISGGNITVIFTDVDDAACTAMMTATAPAPCSTTVVCEDEISGTVIPPAGCDVSGIEVTVTAPDGTTIVLTTDANGVYDSSPTAYPCGDYTVSLTANVPTCYTDANGETGPKPFTIDDDPTDVDTDGTDFVPGTPPVCEITATVASIVCDNMATPEDGTDDTEVVTLTITSSGPWTAGDGTTGVSGDTYAFPATVTGGTLTMMFSVDGDTCDTTFTYIVVGCDTPAIPTLSQWGLMILALLMMTFGALKIGSVSLRTAKE